MHTPKHTDKRCKKGSLHWAWRGGLTKLRGRYLVYTPEHPMVNSAGYVLRSRLVAEKAMGKILPAGVVVHHGNEYQGNDKNSNLVICENDRYHKLLHQRKRAYDACGNASRRKCWICKQYDVPEKLYINQSYSNGGTIYHKKCNKEYRLRLSVETKRKQKNAV